MHQVTQGGTAGGACGQGQLPPPVVGVDPGSTGRPLPRHLQPPRPVLPPRGVAHQPHQVLRPWEAMAAPVVTKMVVVVTVTMTKVVLMVLLMTVVVLVLVCVMVVLLMVYVCVFFLLKM